MRYYNDSSQVKKCLNYENSSSELDSLNSVCNCCNNCKKKNNLKMSFNSKPIRWFDDENHIYLSRYKLDYREPPTNVFQSTNYSNSPKETLDNTNKPNKNFNNQSIITQASSSNTHISKKDVSKSKLKSKPKKSSMSTKTKRPIIPATTPVKPEKRIFRDLKDHFAEQPLLESKKVQIEPKNTNDSFEKTAFQKVCSPCPSFLSTDIDLVHLNKSQESLINNKKDDKLTLNSAKTYQINRAYFVEPIDLNDNLNTTVRKNRNICKHINLVCDACAKKFDVNKHKLYQFELTDFYCRK